MKNNLLPFFSDEGEMLYKCEGDTVEAKCQNNMIANWKEAQYLVSTDVTSDSPICMGQFHNTADDLNILKDCMKNVSIIVNETCNDDWANGSSCSFVVNDAVLGGHPCFTYIVDVTYICYGM